jgi:hypothetical protein
MPREWDTPLREPWNVLIHQALQGIDRHNRLYLATGERWHVEQAAVLRTYVHELKTWILKQESDERAS